MFIVLFCLLIVVFYIAALDYSSMTFVNLFELCFTFALMLAYMDVGDVGTGRAQAKKRVSRFVSAKISAKAEWDIVLRRMMKKGTAARRDTRVSKDHRRHRRSATAKSKS